MKKFVVGVQYYAPPHSNKQMWVKDFKLIKECGLDTVKVWAIWGYLEPTPNKYDFSELNQLFEVAQEYELSVVINTVIEIQPFWIHRLFPEAYMLDQYGRPILSTTGEYSCGISPGVCLDYPEPRAQAERFLTNIAYHFKNKKNLLCWDAWNETRWQDNINGHTPFQRIPCYCEKTIEKFREWLQKKYDSLNGLNKKWRRKYTNWVDVTPPRGGNWSYAYPEMINWRNFMVDYVVDKLKLRVDALRKGDDKHPIMMHAGSSSVRYSRAISFVGHDDWKNNYIVDIYGTSFYPLWRGKIEEMCLSIDAIRSASKNKSFWISELQGGPSFHSPGKGNNYSPQQLKFWSYFALSEEAKGILWWGWRPEPFGPEALGFGLTLFDGTPTRRAKMLKEITHVIKRNESTFLNSKVCSSQVAILFDPSLYIIDWYGSVIGIEKEMISRSFLGYYKAFWDNNIWCDFIHAEELENIRDYKLIVLPFSPCLRREVAQRIRQYIEDGGKVIAEAYFGRFEEDGVPAFTAPCYGLHRIFKVRGKEVEFVNTIEITIEKNKEFFKGIDSLTGYYYKEELNYSSDSEILGRFKDGTPAIVKGNYGEGETILFGSLMGLAYLNNVNNNFKKLIHNISKLADIPSVVEIVYPMKENSVRTRILRSGENYVIFCLNYGQKTDLNLKVYLPDPKFVKEVITGSRLKYSLKDDHIEITTEIANKDVKVLLIGYS